MVSWYQNTNKKTALIVIGALIAGILVGFFSSKLMSPNFSEFNAVTMNRNGTFELDMTPEDALPLFTAPGETLWAPGWEPFILNGDGVEQGTIWVTTGHGHTSYWYVTDYDTTTKHAQYVRVTPGADVGTVDISIEANSSGGSTVNVTYRLTGLSKSGNERVSNTLSESAYSERMKHWQSLIEDNKDSIQKHLQSRGEKR
ncbi:MAG: hypothetical protein AAF512_06345 [Pseudomonadota bacterium]